MSYRSPSGRFIAWRMLLYDAARAGGRWITAFPDAPTTLVRDIRQRRPRVLAEHSDGRLVAEARNAYPNETTGTEYGDIYVRWTTDPQEEPTVTSSRHDLRVTDQIAAELDALAFMLDPTQPSRGRRSRAAAAVLTEYAAGQPRPSTLNPYDPVRFAAYVDDEVWETALLRAEREGVSIPAVLAEFAPKMLDRERRIKQEGADLT